MAAFTQSLLFVITFFIFLFFRYKFKYTCIPELYFRGQLIYKLMHCTQQKKKNWLKFLTTYLYMRDEHLSAARQTIISQRKHKVRTLDVGL